MSNQQHTPEPWRLGRFSGPASYEKVRETCGAMDVVVDTDTGPYVLAGCNINFPDDAKANARRIVACVNACAGIPTDVLEDKSILKADADLRIKRDALTKQRDELLAALKRAETAMEVCSDWITEIEMDDGWTTTADEKLKISAAIASVKGGS